MQLSFLDFLTLTEAAQPMSPDFDPSKFAQWLNSALKPVNYQVSPLAALGKPGKVMRAQREFRLQLINKLKDTSDVAIAKLHKVLKPSEGVSSLKFNVVSPNSSKFPSFTFKYAGQVVDLVVARGANKGENFETSTVANLAQVFGKTNKSPEFAALINQMNEANPKFAAVEITSVKQRTGSTKKENVPIEKLGAIIGDIVLKDSTGHEWFISLKDTSGNTFSSYSGASTLFDANGNLDPTSAGADFVRSFGVDLNEVQHGYDSRNNSMKPTLRSQIPLHPANSADIKKIFERAWGMNYFYVRKQTSGWKVFWLDRNKLDELSGGIKVTRVSYPNAKSKQLSIYCSNSKYSYLVEVRNSKGGEYPNDIKIKIL